MMLLLAGRAGFEPAAELFPSTHLAGEPNRPLWHLPKRLLIVDLRLLIEILDGQTSISNPQSTIKRRRERDSNPRWVAPHLFSRQAP